MGDASLAQPTPTQSPLWRLRHSPAVSEAAMALFVVLSSLSIVVAGSSPGVFSVWHSLGIVGIVLIGASLLVSLVTHRESKGVERQRHPRVAPLTFTLVAVCIAALMELVLVLRVTQPPVAAVSALFGGRLGTPVLEIAVAQPLLVGVVALAWSRLSPAPHFEYDPATRRSWFGLLGISGMVVTSGAFAAWLINTIVVSGRPWNVGTRFQGLLLAMVVLAAMALVCAPGIIWRTEDGAAVS